jgi:CheY-like chemotaxis protein
MSCPVCSSPIVASSESTGSPERQAALPFPIDADDLGSDESSVRLFLNALLENLDDAVVACDESGALIMFNRASRKLHGLPEEPLPVERWAGHYDLYQADGATPMAREDEPLFRALRGERVKDVEMVVATRGLPPRSLLASGKALFGSDGRRLGALVVMHDITERKRAEEYALHNVQVRIRQEQAMVINDNVIQALIVANWAFEAGDQTKGMAALRRGIEASQEIVRRQIAELEDIGPLTAGTFTRKVPAISLDSEVDLSNGPPVGWRVLLVDDAEEIRTMVRRILEGDGRFSIVGEAENGLEAVGLTASTAPHVVLLDISMPVMNGLEAIPLIRKGSPATKIIMLSSLEASSMIPRASELGADGYIEKGMSLKDLGDTISKICETGVEKKASRT